MRIVAWPARSNAARNPYQKLLYDAVEAQGVEVREMSVRALAGPADVWHLHWPDVFLAAGRGAQFWLRLVALRALLLLARVRRIPVVWTAHNLRRTGQRNADRLDRWFWDWFLGRLDGVVFLTEAAREAALASEQSLRETPSVVVPHGHYGPVISSARSEVVAHPPTVLSFGTIAPYKNVHVAVQAFAELPPGSATLCLAGQHSRALPDPRVEDALAALPADARAHVVRHARFLDEDELVRLLRGATVAVFPYEDVLSSGAAIFALSAGCPIVTSSRPVFHELAELVPGDWVQVVPRGLDGASLHEALQRAANLRHDGGVADLSALEWEPIAQHTLAFLRSLGAPEASVA